MYVYVVLEHHHPLGGGNQSYETVDAKVHGVYGTRVGALKKVERLITRPTKHKGYLSVLRQRVKG